MWWVEHGWVVSTVAKCVDTSWTGKTEQQETGRTYYPMKLLERDSSEEKTKKEQSQWQTETSERPPQPQLPPTAQGRAEEGTEIPIPAGSHHKHLHSLHNLVFFQEHPEILGISATFPLFQIFPGQIFALPSKYILHLGWEILVTSLHGFFVCSHFPKGSNMSGCLWHVYLQKKKGISLWNALLNGRH